MKLQAFKDAITEYFVVLSLIKLFDNKLFIKNMCLKMKLAMLFFTIKTLVID